MKYRSNLFVFLIIIFLLTGSLQLIARRIVTLAPALTEIVFSLGQGNQLVGNTNYCNFPEEAKQITRVGGFMDINLEVLVSLKPDIIILYPENVEKIKIMKDKAKLVIVKHSKLDDIFDAVTKISTALGVELKGKELVSRIQKDLVQLKNKAVQKTLNKKQPKALLIIGRNPDKLSNMYIIGGNDFLNRLLEIAGGVNAYQGDINYPSISVESVAAMNPDVIIELSAFNEGMADEKVFDLWKKYPFISAVKNNNITIVKNAMWVIPGPRIARIAENMHNVLFKKH